MVHATNITGLSYYASGCVTTVGDSCAGIGVTLSGSTSNPFLNNSSDKSINIGFGNYLTFNEPFFGQGDSLTITVGFDDSTSVSDTVTLPDLTTGGKPIMTLIGGGGTITFTSTSLVADRMSFGFAPATFQPSGTNDTIIEMSLQRTRVLRSRQVRRS